MGWSGFSLPGIEQADDSSAQGKRRAASSVDLALSDLHSFTRGRMALHCELHSECMYTCREQHSLTTQKRQTSKGLYSTVLQSIYEVLGLISSSGWWWMTDGWNCCKCSLRMSGCKWYSAACRVGVNGGQTPGCWLTDLLELAFVFTLLVVRRMVQSRLKDHT